MDYDLLYPSRFLKSAQFKGKDVTLTISKVYVEELEGDKGKKQKGIISFGERTFEWVLNRTNGEALKAMFGRETDQWIGKRVTLYPEPFRDMATGEPSTCIRVRGSPDLERDISFELKLPRKKAVTKRLLATGKKTQGAPASPPLPRNIPASADPDAEPPEGLELPTA